MRLRRAPPTGLEAPNPAEGNGDRGGAAAIPTVLDRVPLAMYAFGVDGSGSPDVETVTDCDVVLDAPPLSVTVSVTVYVPPAA